MLPMCKCCQLPVLPMANCGWRAVGWECPRQEGGCPSQCMRVEADWERRHLGGAWEGHAPPSQAAELSKTGHSQVAELSRNGYFRVAELPK